MNSAAAMYRALVVRERPDGKFEHAVEKLPLSFLPGNDTLIRVHYSSLNYKDALSFSGHKGITRKFPHTPGIDAAGVIEKSANPAFKPGDEVIVTGFDMGMNTAGGLSELIQVPSEWVIPKPKDLSLKDCMTVGTAGFTAAQAVFRTIQNQLDPSKGDFLVTGATGGVGSVAVCLFAKAGYRVVAASRDAALSAWLKNLGAAEVIHPDEITNIPDKPMVKGRWAGALDTLGGDVLNAIIRSTQHRAVVSFCGMILGPEINTTVFPFILRGLTLVGIDSAECPIEGKREIWNLLNGDWHLDAQFSSLRQEIDLDDAPAALQAMLDGKGANGRVIVRIA